MKKKDKKKTGPKPIAERMKNLVKKEEEKKTKKFHNGKYHTNLNKKEDL